MQAIEERIANWTHLPPENGEPIEVLRYRDGQKYSAHWDFFEDKFNDERSGNRVATVLMYLAGGCRGKGGGGRAGRKGGKRARREGRGSQPGGGECGGMRSARGSGVPLLERLHLRRVSTPCTCAALQCLVHVLSFHSL